MIRRRGRGRHEFGRGKGTHIGNGTNANIGEQNTIATSQFAPNPQLSEAFEIGANPSTLYLNGKM